MPVHGLSPQMMIVIAVAIYGLPGFVAVALGRRQQWGVVALDLLLGWTVVGWIAAMAWACRKPRQRTTRRVADFANDNRTDGSGATTLWDEPAELLRVDPYAEWLDLGTCLDEPDVPSQGAEPTVKPQVAAA